MPLRRVGTTTERPLRESGETLVRSAGVVRLGLLAVGVAVVFHQVGPLVSDAQLTWGERRVAGIVAVITLGGFVLAGWVVGSILRAAGGLIGAVADATDAAVRAGDLVETQLVPAVTRAVVAIERLASEPRAAPSSKAAFEVETAIGEGRWGRAERLLDELARTDPNATEHGPLAERLAEAKHVEAVELRRQLDEAMSADDAEAALARRDGLTLHLQGASLRNLDARVARWLGGWLRGQVRLGAFTPSLAEIASRGAERFGDTPDGRSLLAAVPDLRRRAGLCPTCARPCPGGDGCSACSDTSAPRPRPGGSRPKGSS